jgi:hypothetical protein
VNVQLVCVSEVTDAQSDVSVVAELVVPCRTVVTAMVHAENVAPASAQENAPMLHDTATWFELETGVAVIAVAGDAVALFRSIKLSVQSLKGEVLKLLVHSSRMRNLQMAPSSIPADQKDEVVVVVVIDGFPVGVIHPMPLDEPPHESSTPYCEKELPPVLQFDELREKVETNVFG